MQTLHTEPVRLVNTGPYTVQVSDRIILTNNASPFNVFLYGIDTETIGHTLYFKNIGAGNVTIKSNASALNIDGANGVVLETNQSLVLKESNSAWYIISSFNPAVAEQVSGDGTTIVEDTPNVLSVNPDLSINSLGLGSAVESGSRLKVNGHMYITQRNDGNTGAAVTVNWLLGNERVLTMNSNTTITFSGGKSGGHYVLVLHQDEVGGWYPTWDANVMWNNNVIPSFSTLANTKELVAFYYDGEHYIGAGSAGEQGFRGVVSAYKGTDEGILNEIEETIEFEQASYDTAGFWDAGAPTRLTVPAGQAGVYDIDAGVGWGLVGTVTSVYARLYVNGSLVAEDGRGGAGAFGTPQSVSKHLRLEVNDYVELKVFVTNGDATVRGGPQRTFLEMARVG